MDGVQSCANADRPETGKPRGQKVNVATLAYM